MGGALDFAGEDAMNSVPEYSYTEQITSELVPETFSYTVLTDWNDDNDRDGERAESVEVTLYSKAQQSEPVEIGTVTLEEGNQWKYTWEDLPKYSGGEEILYLVTESEVEGYTTSYYPGEEADTVIVNTHSSVKENIAVRTVWDDAENEYRNRPDEIRVELLADGISIPTDTEETGTYETLSAQNNWEAVFADVPVLENHGQAVRYSIADLSVTGYTASIGSGIWDADANTLVFTVTNTLETMDLTVFRDWADQDNQDGIRRDAAVILNGFVDGNDGAVIPRSDTIPLEGDDPTCTFRDLPLYCDGKEVAYRVTEEEMAGYEVSFSEMTVSREDSGKWTGTVTMTNSHTPATTKVTAHEVWDDQEDQDGMRADYTLSLYYTVASSPSVVRPYEDPVTLSAEVTDYTWESLPLYQSGSRITYYVTENGGVPFGYTVSYSDYDRSEDGTSSEITITNSHDVKKTDIVVTLTWDDEENYYKDRPEEVQVALYKDGKKAEGVRNLVLNEENDWTGTFEDLDVYSHGSMIGYTVAEDPESPFYLPETTYRYDEKDVMTGADILNAHRYYRIEEEIVPEEDDEDTWVRTESVSAGERIEFEMSTTLPKISFTSLAGGSYTMVFHDVLTSELDLDPNEGHYEIFIGEKGGSKARTESAGIAPVSRLARALEEYTSEETGTETLYENQVSAAYYTITTGELDDGCDFEVTVDLSSLYNDGVITEADLGVSTIRIFFYAELDEEEARGVHTSTVYYQVYDEEELKFTSNTDVVSVYNFDIRVYKYDADTDAPLKGAVFGLYSDEACKNPVLHGGEPYVATSDADGILEFKGIPEGTYNLKELAAPEGYATASDAVKIRLSEESAAEFVYSAAVGNSVFKEPVIELPESGSDPAPAPKPAPAGGPSSSGSSGENTSSAVAGSTESTGVSAATGDMGQPVLYLLLSAAALSVISLAAYNLRRR